MLPLLAFIALMAGCSGDKQVTAVEKQSDFGSLPSDSLMVEPQVVGAWITVAWPFGGGENPNNWVGWQGNSSGGIAGSFCSGSRNNTHAGADRMARDLSRAGCNGVNIYAGIQGLVVQAVSNCQNVLSDCNGGYGNTVVIYDHSRRVALRYSHLSSVGVSVGQQVSIGSYLGQVGRSGKATGPHLHLAAYENIDHWHSYPNNPVIPNLCDGEWYTCATYFYTW